MSKNKHLSRKQIRKMIAKNKELEEFLLEEHVLTKYIENARVHSFTHREEIRDALEGPLGWAIMGAFYWECTDEPNLWAHVDNQIMKRTLTIVHYEKNNTDNR